MTPTTEMVPTPEPVSSPEMTRRSVRGKSASITSQPTKVADSALTRQVQGDIRPGDVPGSERIVSVTDRVVGPTADSGDAPQVVADLSTDSSLPLPSKQWTARRPTPSVIR